MIIEDKWHNHSVKDIIDYWADNTPDKIFFISPDNDITKTYAQLREDIRSFVANLAVYEIRQGQAIAYALANGYSSVLIILTAFYAGFKATAINIVAGKNTIEYVIKHSEAKIVFVQQNMKELLDNSIKEQKLPMISIECPADKPAAHYSKPSGRLDNIYEPKPADEALLIYTSGTTGQPKGVLHAHSSIIAGGVNTAIAHQLNADDRTLCVLPLYHINALCVSLMGSLVCGSSIVVPRKFSTSTFWQYIEKHKCSWFSVVPTIISYLLHEDDNLHRPVIGNQLRFGRSASAPLSAEVQKSFENKFRIPIIETMGLTETAAQILANPMLPATRKIGSPGIEFGNKVMIADEKQKPLGKNQQGELLVKGKNVMKGYFKNPEASKEALTASDWFRTGDLGKMDEDGYIFITGRIKDIIIKGGENITPREIDDALYSHPHVIEAAAFPRPCKNYGQTIEAAVVVDEYAKVQEKELMELCTEKVGKFKKPDVIHFMTELPKGPSGKINRRKIAQLFDKKHKLS